MICQYIRTLGIHGLSLLGIGNPSLFKAWMLNSFSPCLLRSYCYFSSCGIDVKVCAPREMLKVFQLVMCVSFSNLYLLKLKMDLKGQYWTADAQAIHAKSSICPLNSPNVSISTGLTHSLMRVVCCIYLTKTTSASPREACL